MLEPVDNLIILAALEHLVVVLDQLLNLGVGSGRVGGLRQESIQAGLRGGWAGVGSGRLKGGYEAGVGSGRVMGVWLSVQAGRGVRTGVHGR